MTPEAPKVPVIYIDSGTISLRLTTILAAAFNFLMIGVVVFGVMPQINRGLQESVRNREAIEQIGVQLERHTVVIKRLNDALDAAEARAKSLKKP